MLPPPRHHVRGVDFFSFSFYHVHGLLLLYNKLRSSNEGKTDPPRCPREVESAVYVHAYLFTSIYMGAISASNDGEQSTKLHSTPALRYLSELSYCRHPFFSPATFTSPKKKRKNTRHPGVSSYVVWVSCAHEEHVNITPRQLSQVLLGKRYFDSVCKLVS